MRLLADLRHERLGEVVAGPRRSAAHAGFDAGLDPRGRPLCAASCDPARRRLGRPGGRPHAGLVRRHGNLAGERDAYQKSLDIALKLAYDEGNAQAQYAIWRSATTSSAMSCKYRATWPRRDAYQKDLTIALNLAHNDSNALAQRDLAISYSTVGVIRQAIKDVAECATPSRRAWRSASHWSATIPRTSNMP